MQEMFVRNDPQGILKTTNVYPQTHPPVKLHCPLSLPPDQIKCEKISHRLKQSFVLPSLVRIYEYTSAWGNN